MGGASLIELVSGLKKVWCRDLYWFLRFMYENFDKNFTMKLKYGVFYVSYIDGMEESTGLLSNSSPAEEIGLKIYELYKKGKISRDDVEELMDYIRRERWDIESWEEFVENLREYLSYCEGLSPMGYLYGKYGPSMFRIEEVHDEECSVVGFINCDGYKWKVCICASDGFGCLVKYILTHREEIGKRALKFFFDFDLSEVKSVVLRKLVEVYREESPPEELSKVDLEEIREIAFYILHRALREGFISEALLWAEKSWAKPWVRAGFLVLAEKKPYDVVVIHNQFLDEWICIRKDLWGFINSMSGYFNSNLLRVQATNTKSYGYIYFSLNYPDYGVDNTFAVYSLRVPKRYLEDLGLEGVIRGRRPSGCKRSFVEKQFRSFEIGDSRDLVRSFKYRITYFLNSLKRHGFEGFSFSLVPYLVGLKDERGFTIRDVLVPISFERFVKEFFFSIPRLFSSTFSWDLRRVDLFVTLLSDRRLVVLPIKNFTGDWHSDFVRFLEKYLRDKKYILLRVSVNSGYSRNMMAWVDLLRVNLVCYVRNDGFDKLVDLIEYYNRIKPRRGRSFKWGLVEKIVKVEKSGVVRSKRISKEELKRLAKEVYELLESDRLEREDLKKISMLVGGLQYHFSVLASWRSRRRWRKP